MKKFLIFLVAIVVVVCVGLTTYYFIRNDEVISFSTLEIYCNVGDRLYLDKDLGYSVTKQEDSTTYDFNAGGKEVTDIIEYDEEKGYYLAKDGGDVTIVITTSNENYAEFKISVHVGDGTSASTPYYISKYSQLVAIGDGYSLSGYYSLTSDIALTSSFTSIGYENGEDKGFSGTFNGNGHVISGLNLSGERTNAGLFTQLIGSAVVSDLTISGATINGSFSNAGVLAGVSYDGATVTRVKVVDSTITNTNNSGVTGGLIANAGASSISVSYVSGTTITVGSADSSSDVNVGGFIGKLECGTIKATYAETTINTLGTVSGNIAGFVGEFIINSTSGSIQQSYAFATSDNNSLSLFIGEISGAIVEETSGFSALSYLVGNYAIGSGSAVNTVDVYVNGNSTSSSDYFFTKLDISSWSDSDKGYYMITTVSDTTEFAKLSTYVFYQSTVSDESIVKWDTNAWSNTTVSGAKPTLNMTTSTLTGVASDYLLRDLSSDGSAGTTDSNIFTIISNSGVLTLSSSNYTLTEDITLDENYQPIKLVNSIIDGAGYTITIYVNNSSVIGSSTYAGLFSQVDASVVKNLNIKVMSYTASATYAGALAGLITSTSTGNSTIQNVNVTYADSVVPTGSYSSLGGLAGTINKSTIQGCSVSNFTASNSTTATNLGGFVGTTSSSTYVPYGSTQNTIDATLTNPKATVVGAFVGVNNSSNISSLIVNAAITANKSGGTIGGIAGSNAGDISDVTATITITINASSSYVGGVAGHNNGTISDVTLSSGSIVVSTNATDVILGGVSATNTANGSISNTYVYLTTIGFGSSNATSIANANLVLGGIVAQNSGKISQCIASSDMYGNYVGGVVAVMNNVSTAQVDSVLVARFSNGSITQNTIAGDKCVAGIVYDFEANGKMTNIQAESLIIGLTNDTECSLMTLIFPYGAELTYATVNSTFGGYGVYYLEAKQDGNYYNIYLSSKCSGKMDNVVINSDAIGNVSYSKSKFVTVLYYGVYWLLDYGGDNYHLLVSASEFNTNSTYTGDKKIDTEKSYGWGGIYSSISVTIDLGSKSAWTTDSINSDSAYMLSFLSSLVG